jgi:ABC-type polysaccharide/polyol phosphate export permease
MPLSVRLPAPLTVVLSFLRKITVQRYLIFNFVVRDLKSRYVGSLMGIFWAVVHPVVLLVCYTFVFSIVFKIRAEGLTTGNFAIFLFCGILPWLFFQDTVLRCCNSVVENSNLIRRTLFPSEILPISLALSNAFTHLLGLAILLVVLVWADRVFWTAVFALFYLLLLIVLSVGLGWLFAALQVFLRDTYQVVSVLMILWFWFTPIFYSVEMVPSSLRPVILLNPMTYVVEGYRYSLLEGRLPNLTHLSVLLAYALLVFFLGGYVFRNTKREFIDVL